MLQILAFCRRTEQKIVPIQIGLILKDAMRMIRSSLPSSIEVRTDIQTKALAMADPTQIHQVLMNLCANAAHAMPGRRRPRGEPYRFPARAAIHSASFRRATRKIPEAYRYGYGAWHPLRCYGPDIRSLFYYQKNGRRDRAGTLGSSRDCGKPWGNNRRSIAARGWEPRLPCSYLPANAR